MEQLNDYTILNDIFNDITNTMIINNLFIKNKIIKKIEIIKNLSNSNIDVLTYNKEKKVHLFNILNSINYKLMNVGNKQNKLNTKLNNILGIIIKNAYIASGFQVLLSNIPNIGNQKIDNKINYIDNISIYDTIEHYIGNDTVENVIQIDNDKYLAKFKQSSDAQKLCNLIHKMMIDPNIIRVEMIETMNDAMDIFVINEIENRITDSHINDIHDIHDTHDTHDTHDYGLGYINKKTPNTVSLYNFSINIIYEKYTKIKETIKTNIKYIFSFFQKTK